MMSKIPSRQQTPETTIHKTTTNTKKKRKSISPSSTSATPPTTTTSSNSHDHDLSYRDDYNQHVSNNNPQDGQIRIYSYEEISLHNTADDLWMVLHGNVYDVTSTVEGHPGGEEVLIDCGGMDATIAFDEVGHSRDSVLMLDPLFMGIVDEDGALNSAVNGTSSMNNLRRDSQSPANNWAYTTDHGDGDGAIKNSRTGRVENVSLGESQYLKRIRLMRQRKKKSLKDEHLLALLATVALLAVFAYIYLERLKWVE